MCLKSTTYFPKSASLTPILIAGQKRKTSLPPFDKRKALQIRMLSKERQRALKVLLPMGQNWKEVQLHILT